MRRSEHNSEILEAVAAANQKLKSSNVRHTIAVFYQQAVFREDFPNKFMPVSNSYLGVTLHEGGQNV